MRTMNKLPRVKQVFIPWDQWECYSSGMYDAAQCTKSDFETFKRSYAKFLSDSAYFYSSAKRMVADWPLSCLNFLTNEQINRVAWIGQAAACYEVGLSSEFRGGFWLLTSKQQDEANGVAFDVLTEWLIEYKRNQEKDHALRERVDQQMLFGWHS
jgi:hypothetical protein